MKIADTLFRSALLVMGAAALLAVRAAAGPFSLLSDGEKMTAVNSKTHNGYVRTTLPDGSIKPETYGFAIGGFLNVSTKLEFSMLPVTADPTIDRLGFGAISRMIEGPLASQRYVATPDPEKADLLIVVYWGRTIGTSAFNGQGVLYGPDQDRINRQNARLLGFGDEPVFEQDGQPLSTTSNIVREAHYDVLSAIKADRYYVILMAFDFQSLWKEKKTKLLWETRFSLSERHHDFGEELPKMALYASQYFGQDTNGLVLRPIPEGRVDVGNPKDLGEVPQP